MGKGGKGRERKEEKGSASSSLLLPRMTGLTLYDQGEGEVRRVMGVHRETT